MKIVEPRIELQALMSVTKTNYDNLSKKTGIPRSRIISAINGYGKLSIDDLVLCKNVLCSLLKTKQDSK